MSNKGKRVRLIGDYAKVFECKTGVIVDDKTDISYIVLLDDGVYCDPFKEKRLDSECELIADDPTNETTQINEAEYTEKEIELMDMFASFAQQMILMDKTIPFDGSQAYKIAKNMINQRIDILKNKQ